MAKKKHGTTLPLPDRPGKSLKSVGKPVQVADIPNTPPNMHTVMRGGKR